MKAYNNLFDNVCSFKNIHSAYLKARRGKRYKKDILLFSFDLENNLSEIKRGMEKGIYKHGGYKEFIVNDSKKRLIKAPTFKDRVVHHSLCNIIEPVFERTFTFDSYACRKGKGTHRAVKRLKSFLKDNNDFFCYKCDISKYFDSIDHDILLSLIKKKIKDRRIMWLVEEVLKSSFSKGKGIGIPIGNLTSQLFANIYLSRFGHFAKNVMREKMCLRYMDDFIFIGKKHRLQAVSRKSISFLRKELRLNVNLSKNIVFPTNKGIDFLGYVVFDKYILLRKSTVRRFLKKMKGAEKEVVKNAWFAYAKHADSYYLSEAIFS